MCHCKSEVTSGEVRKQNFLCKHLSRAFITPSKSCMIRNEKATAISGSYTYIRMYSSLQCIFHELCTFHFFALVSEVYTSIFKSRKSFCWHLQIFLQTSKYSAGLTYLNQRNIIKTQTKKKKRKSYDQDVFFCLFF